MKFSLPPAASSFVRGLCLALPLLAATPAHADAVICHYSYGGETKALVAAPVASPYAVEGIEVGSYFLFRAVFQKTPKDVAAIRVYTYAKRDDNLVLIHEATYPYPLAARSAHAPYGFSGLHFVYEPMREGELQYWCELAKPTAKRKAR